MTETVNSTPNDGRGWRSGRLKQALAMAPMARPVIRYVPKHPALMIGAAVVGVAGVLAWRNRRRIAETARPMIENAAARGSALRERMSRSRSPEAPADQPIGY